MQKSASRVQALGDADPFPEMYGMAYIGSLYFTL